MNDFSLSKPLRVQFVQAQALGGSPAHAYASSELVGLFMRKRTVRSLLSAFSRDPSITVSEVSVLLPNDTLSSAIG